MCDACRGKQGIYINHLNNPRYLSLHNKNIADLTGNEFKLLLYLRKKGVTFHHKFNYYLNLCEDSVYKILDAKQFENISQKEMEYLELLRNNCIKMERKMEKGVVMMWEDKDISNPGYNLKFKSIGLYLIGGGAAAGILVP